MPDDRFFARSGPFSLVEIARAAETEEFPTAAAATVFHGIGTLEGAKPNEVSVFADIRYQSSLAQTRAGLIITHRALAARVPQDIPLLIVDDPRRAYAKVGQLFYPPSALESGISPATHIHANARIGAGSRIDAGAIVEDGAEIGRGCHIAHNAVVGRGVLIADGSKVGANSNVNYALIGKIVNIASGVTIGSEGFGFVQEAGRLKRTPQLGRVIIGDGVEIGANCTIDRGAMGDTIIGTGSVLDNQVHIAHNVRLGRCCIVCAQVGIAGSTIVGDGVTMGGQSGIADHLKIGAYAKVAAKSGVIRDVATSATVGGYPATAIRAWHRQTAGLARIFQRTGPTFRSLQHTVDLTVQSVEDGA